MLLLEVVEHDAKFLPAVLLVIVADRWNEDPNLMLLMLFVRITKFENRDDNSDASLRNKLS